MTDVDDVKLQQTLGDVYRPGQLRFCHDPAYRLSYSDRWLCSIDEAPQRCPALQKLCSTSVEPFAASKSSGRETAPWISGLADVIFWLLMGALLVAIGVAMAGMRNKRRGDPPAATEPPSLAPLPAETPTAVEGDKDVVRLLDKARRAAERGELGVAIDAAHAAAVQGLSAAGHVDLDRDRTNGDYLRDLQKQPPLREQFSSIVGQVEAAQFGGRPPSRGAFDLLLEEVMSLLRRLAVLSLGALSMLALLSCGAAGGAPESEERAPHGLYALRRLLSDQGAKVHQRFAALSKIGADVGLVVVYGTALEDGSRQRVLSWVREGGALIVIGSEELAEVTDVELRVLGCRGKASRGHGIELPPLRLGLIGARGVAPVPSNDGYVVHRVDVTCDDQPYIVTAFVGDGRITYLPERELVSNASLSMGDNARLIAELMATPGETVELIGPWTGDGSQSPVQSMKAAGLSPVMLQLFALALLLAVRQGTSFGARRDVKRHERRAFADHVRALASTYARASAAQLAASHYGAFLIDQLRERTCPGQHPTLLELASAIARRVERPEAEIVRLLVDAKSSFDEGADQSMNRKLISELEQLSLQAGGIS